MFEQSRMKLFKEDTSQIPEFGFITQALLEGITIKRNIVENLM